MNTIVLPTADRTCPVIIRNDFIFKSFLHLHSNNKIKSRKKMDDRMLVVELYLNTSEWTTLLTLSDLANSKLSGSLEEKQRACLTE